MAAPPGPPPAAPPPGGLLRHIARHSPPLVAALNRQVDWGIVIPCAIVSIPLVVGTVAGIHYKDAYLGFLFAALTTVTPFAVGGALYLAGSVVACIILLLYGTFCVAKQAIGMVDRAGRHALNAAQAML